jgi:hypothetical protein
MRDPFKLFQREFDRRFKKYEGKYDYIDFAFELFKEKTRIKETHVKHEKWRDRIEYAL